MHSIAVQGPEVLVASVAVQSAKYALTVAVHGAEKGQERDFSSSEKNTLIVMQK